MTHVFAFGRLLNFCLILGSALSIPSPTAPSHKIQEVVTTVKSTTNSGAAIATKAPIRSGNLESKATTTMGAVTIRPPMEEQPLYRLDGSNGQACILLQVDAVLTVKYRNKLKEEVEANVYVPDQPTIKGSCDNENVVTMTLEWGSFILLWNFAKTPGGERWYVDKIELVYNSDDRHFEHHEQPKKTFRLSSVNKYGPMLFPTPVGKSFVCSDEQQVELTDGKNDAVLFLRDMKLQPFKFKNNRFAAEFSCTSLSARADRSETAPLAVGTTFALAVILTVSGYAGYRYMKIKKVEYNTMQ